MTSTTPTPSPWDPDRYLAYAPERARPFVDLLARVQPAQPPRTVVDLGCGPGNLTALLAQRWPDAAVVGVDSSAAMVERAREVDGIEAVHADLRAWRPEVPVDVLVSNATLQWVPDHLALVPDLVACVRPGGWLALQVPGNFSEPSHALRAELAAEEPYAAHLAGIEQPASHDPVDYLGALVDAGCASEEVDVWETTYTHVLRGPDPVLTWVSGTGARPTLHALPDDLRESFTATFGARLRAAYPPRPDGSVLLPFRRVFAVARVGTA